MTESTNRLSLPLLVAGQAQKEIWHNEALMLVDALVQLVVVAVAAASVPVSPAAGQCWIVGPAPTGLWAGKAHHLACWTSGGWRFSAPFEGMTCWSLADTVTTRFSSGIWQKGVQTAMSLSVNGQQVVGARRPAIADPSGGTSVDTEARFALAALLSAVRTHGLIAP